MALTFSKELVADTLGGSIVAVTVNNPQAPDVSVQVIFFRSWMTDIEFKGTNAELCFSINRLDELSKYVKLSEITKGPRRGGDISIDLPERPLFECPEYPQLCSAYRSFRAELNTTWAEDHPEYAGLINSLKILFTGVKA